ncbi:MAG: serine/threonine-protein kinase [Myxococcota bacterium]
MDSGVENNELLTTGVTPTQVRDAPGEGFVQAPGAGSRMGRYLLLQEVGSGGMGVVMEAYDQELDRRVALKLLRPHLSRTGEARMRREARMLAQLQHPSVVTVFEVGVFDGQLFIAMEFVDGETFDRWVAAHRPPWRQILGVAIEAARGLGAAHAVGLIHRDMKPSNVLVGKDGRVCVADFGIATATEPSDEADVPSQASRLETGSQESMEILAAASERFKANETTPHTEHGTVVGTPAFMAPEQHRGQGVDARSDQFAFCVTLYRMLYGEAPFAGDDLQSLRARVCRGAINPPPAGVSVPNSVRRVLLRGLAVDPQRRWPTMQQLIVALERCLRRRRRRLGVVIGGAIIGASAATWMLSTEPAEGASCSALEEPLVEVWDDERRASMRDAFVASELPYALDTWSRTSRRLDRQARRWSDRYGEVCMAMGDQGASVTLDLEMGCLRQRREELRALVELLIDGEAETIAKAIQAAAELEPVETCRARGAEAAAMAPPAPEQQAEVDEIRLLLARAEAAYKAGRIATAFESAERAHTRAQALGYPPVEVEASFRLGMLQGIRSEFEQSEANLGSAALRAVEARHDRIAAQAAIMQAFVIGYQLGRHSEGMTSVRHAQAAIDRLGPDPMLDAQLRVTRAAILTAQGEFDEALRDFRHGLAQREKTLGHDHPVVASSYNNLGSVLVELGRFDEALTALETAREIWEGSYGPRHPMIATALNGIGAVLEQMGRWPEARDRIEQALAIREQTFGPDHVNVAITLDNLGSVLTYMGEYEEARKASQRALELRERTLGSDHPHIASSLVNLGLVAEKEARFADAVSYHRRAISLWEETLGPDHPYLGFPLTSVGRVDFALGHRAQAKAELERALTLRAEGSKPAERAETRLALAMVVWADDPQRARDLATQAQQDVTGDVPRDAALRGEIETWLQEHPAAPP